MCSSRKGTANPEIMLKEDYRVIDKGKLRKVFLEGLLGYLPGQNIEEFS
jgi:hypothetical protein